VFQPVYRPHAQEHIPAEPVFHDRETRDIVRDYIKLRYRLLPYVYTLAYENSMSGMPLMRPLFFEDEENLELIDEKDAFLWGDAFLVAPVLEAGAKSVDVDLPQGVWFDFWDGTRFAGSQSVSVPVTLETIPVLVRAGSFIPMVDDIATTRDYSSEALTLHYYADASVAESQGQMYEDDGKSRLSLENGLFELLAFDSVHDNQSLSMNLRREGKPYAGRPETRTLTLVIHNWDSVPANVNFNGATVELQRRVPRKAMTGHYDADKKLLTVNVEWDHSAANLQVN